MAWAYDITESTEAAIISLSIHVEWADLLGDAVLHLIRLDQPDRDRMHALAVKN
jgi:hypothetical protein